MDYMMPGMSLQDFLRESKSWGLNVILMTGHDEAVAMAELPGIVTSLQKPIPLDVILRIIGRIAKAPKF
jgi:DNA-binding NtrC family response regulator